VVYHDGYAFALTGAPFDPLRAERILAFLRDNSLVRSADVSSPIPASYANIARVHTAAYLDMLDAPATMLSVLGFEVPPEQWQRLIDVQRLMTGGTIQATRLALRSGQIVVNLGGGFHHATPDRGMGFCTVNDVAIAVARLRSKGFLDPILVVDLDIHDGNGTRAAFAGDPTVYTLSIHNETWDDAPATADTCVALGANVDDATYLAAVAEVLPPALSAHRPHLVIYVAGVDPAEDDGLGNWEITAAGLLQRDRYVMECIREVCGQVPVVAVLAGGYGERAWRHSARWLAWLQSGRIVDPTEDMDAVLRRYRRKSGERRRVKPADQSVADWSFTADDLQVFAPHGTAATRALGVYSRHRIELALERLGMLNQVRALGFVAPTVTIDRTSSVGDTIRLFGDGSLTELLIELRARRDGRAVPGMQMLYVEWLLLQNPRADFAADRPRLPGQERPGLGLLREMVAALVVVCDDLGLDGITFVPAHFYMAALGRRHLRFVRPEDAAVFEAMRRAVAGLPLAEATRAIEDGRVVHAVTGAPVTWHAPRMVLPVSDRLKAVVGGQDGDGIPAIRSVPDYRLRRDE